MDDCATYSVFPVISGIGKNEKFTGTASPDDQFIMFTLSICTFIEPLLLACMMNIRYTQHGTVAV